MRQMNVLAFALLACVGLATSAYGQDEADNPWPREIPTSQGTVVFYQPQAETLEDNLLKGRAALAIEANGSEDPLFGAVWFSARLETDRDERTATLTDITVVRTRFPDQDETKAAQLKALLEAEMPKWDMLISLDRLLTSLDVREQRISAASQISTEPPIIIFMPEPAVLITVDGEPRLKKEEDSNLMRVINTPYTVLLDSSNKTYYLNADAKTWYTSTDIKGEWTVAQSVPQEVAALAPEPDPAEIEDPEEIEEGGEPGPPPVIVVATDPTELISSTSEPEYTPIPGTDLLYMSNTDSDVLLHLTTQLHYVLLAGRWFAADSLDGPWAYLPGEDLPDDFADIPEDDEMGTVLYAVPGTDLAEEALIDAQIPQTATIEREKASLEVEYDGDPEFEDIDDTSMQYALNSPTPVIKAEKTYYAVDDAVWFVASSPTGPWVVATSVPDAIYAIPPTSPVYHVTYVHIYSHTDDVVYVGYLPGYNGTYVYNTAIVYGTGYYYPYWYRTRYYPRYSTWGFHVRYNPWGGWSFGLSYSTGPFTFYVGRGSWYRGGWWGPRRYRGYRGGYRHGRRSGYRAGYRAGQRNSNQRNMYNNQRNQARSTPQSQARNQTAGGNRANNVFADSSGNVHRRNDQGSWEQRSQNGWQGSTGQQPSTGQQSQQRPASTQTQPTQRPASQSYSQPSSSSNNASQNQQLNNSYNNRQRGSQRTNSYNRSRSSGSRGAGRRR